MSTVQTGKMTADEFWEWCSRPENQEKRVELVRGEIEEMPRPGEVHGSECWWLGVLLGLFVLQRGRGRATSNDTGFLVEEDPDTIRAPDILFFDEIRPLDSLNWKHTRQVPTLVIEVVSPNDKPNKINKRVAEYLTRGVPLVWVVDPGDKTVGVHRKGELPQILDEGDELNGQDVLPDLTLTVADIFSLPGTAPPANKSLATVIAELRQLHSKGSTP